MVQSAFVSFALHFWHKLWQFKYQYSGSLLQGQPQIGVEDESVEKKRFVEERGSNPVLHNVLSLVQNILLQHVCVTQNNYKLTLYNIYSEI